MIKSIALVLSVFGIAVNLYQIMVFAQMPFAGIGLMLCSLSLGMLIVMRWEE